MNLEELFTKLKNNEENIDTIAQAINEINEKINSGEFTFNKNHTDELYAYMLYCNKLEIKDTLNKLINDENFIKVLDNTDIDGSIIPSLTDICDKPRTKLMMHSKKLKDTILSENGLISTEEILNDLTTEEIKILRNDFEIDNYLIAKGISFSTLKDETVKRLLSDTNIFRLYNIYTISDFANNYKDQEELLDNEAFLTIYFEKLNDDYHYDNKLFKHFNIDQVRKIISTSPGLHILLHLLKNTNEEIQKLLLKNKQVKDYLKNNIDVEILISLPKELLLEILKDKEQLLSNKNIRILDHLTDKELKQLYRENKHLYKELLSDIANYTDEHLKRFINALPQNELKDLCENILMNLDLKTINKLLKTENEHIRNSILKNVDVCNKIINNTTTKTFKLFEDILKTGRYTGEEIVKMINNISETKKENILTKLVDIVPISLRKDIYNNKVVREEVFKEKENNLDEYAIKHLLNNVDELKKQTAETIITVLNNSDIEFTEKVLKDETVLEKIFNNQEATHEIISIINVKRKLLPILRNEKVIDLYTKYNIRNLLDNLTAKEQIDLCNNDLIRKLLNNQEDSYTLYKKLANNNKYILNTVNFEFLSIPNLSEIKLSNLEIITKYPSIQEDIVRINKHFNIVPNFINSLFYNTTKLSFVETISYCLTLIRKAAEGDSRKLIGNIPKMLTSYEKELTKKEYISLISYLLYLIPRYRKEKGELVERPIILDTPNSFYDILAYENNLEKELTNIISTCKVEEIRNNFLMKHFKLTEEEATIMLKMYSIDRLDNTIYKEEYNTLNSLYRIMNTDPESLKEMDETYPSISMYDSFVIEKQIKEMYGKIFNVEIRSKTYSNKPFVKTLYGKEITLYTCPNDFLFLVSNIDLDEEFKYTNSYFEAWHNILNKTPKGIPTSLISNDNFVINNDIIFGFNGVLDSGINSISNINRCPECQNNTKNKYMTPRELIDNTRDVNNTIIIDRFAVRPNYNNSNIPNIEPDFILADIKKIDDNQYLEMISRASEEFKTKRNKNGLPIIVYDIDKIAANELSKIKTQTKKYLKTYDMNILPTILTKLENNYISYRTYNIEIANKFAIEELINIIKERINKSNSVSELSYIEELLTKEYEKYLKINKELGCNYNIKEILPLINERKNTINNY